MSIWKHYKNNFMCFLSTQIRQRNNNQLVWLNNLTFDSASKLCPVFLDLTEIQTNTIDQVKCVIVDILTFLKNSSTSKPSPKIPDIYWRLQICLFEIGAPQSTLQIHLYDILTEVSYFHTSIFFNKIQILFLKENAKKFQMETINRKRRTRQTQSCRELKGLENCQDLEMISSKNKRN